MPYADKEIDGNVREIAKKLAKNDRFSDGALIQIGEVFAPIWLTYVSRAEQLIADRSVLGK